METKTRVSGRISFPHLFEPTSFSPDQEKKFEATIIMDKERDAESIAALKKVIGELISEKWKKRPGGLKIGLRDGSEKEGSEGYGSGVMFFSARSKNRPTVLDQRRNPIVAEDGLIYPGANVVAVVNPWAQSNAYGQRVNFGLLGVQFHSHNDAFGSTSAIVSDFEDLGDDPMMG